MARQADPKIADRNQALIEDFRNNPLQSDLDLSEKYGIKVQRIRQILSQAGMFQSKRRPPHGAEAGELKPRSNLHVLIGEQIQESLKDISLAETVKSMSFTAITLNRVIRGCENLTLSELQRISKWMDKPLSKMFRDAEKKESQYSVTKLENTGSSVNCSTDQKMEKTGS